MEKQKTDCWDLTESIYAFHDGISRDLFNAYNSPVDDLYMVSKGSLALGLIDKEEIPNIERIADPAPFICFGTFLKESSNELETLSFP